MSIIISNNGKEELLKRILNFSGADNLKLKLFSNDLTPSETNVLGDFTEVSGDGYAEIELTGTSWNISTASNISTATYAIQTFTFTGAKTIYGYYITDNSDSLLLWSERFDNAPYSIPITGGDVDITPLIKFKGELE